MSKIGKKPIHIKEGMTVTVEGSQVHIAGVKGQVNYVLPAGVQAVVENGQLVVTADQGAVHGLTRANIANAIKGVDAGFEKKLELQGVGYRAQMQGNDLVLSLGFSHPVKFQPDKDIKISVAENVITIAGVDKALVGLTAANIRGIKPPEPYKGKGIRYKGEQVKRKAGKAAKAVGGAK